MPRGEIEVWEFILTCKELVLPLGTEPGTVDNTPALYHHYSQHQAHLKEREAKRQRLYKGATMSKVSGWHNVSRGFF